MTSDTKAPVEDEEAMLERYRQMSPWEKIQEVERLNQLAFEEEAARIRTQYGPDTTDWEVRLRILSRQVDRETMIKGFGWDPEAPENQ
jgi:hypothetical protein